MIVTLLSEAAKRADSSTMQRSVCTIQPFVTKLSLGNTNRQDVCKKLPEKDMMGLL